VSHQRALTLVAEVRPEATDALRELLATMGDGVANDERLDFGALSALHFARLVLVEEAVDLKGARLPASLLYMSDFDIAKDRHLAELVVVGGDEIDRIFGHCVGYPSIPATREQRFAFLSGHVIREHAVYVNTVGRTARQIRQEDRLRERIEAHFDAHADVLAPRAPEDIRREVQQLVEQDSALHWARRPAEGTDLGFRLREWAHAIAVPLLVLLLLPILLIALPFYLVLLRWHERRDPAPHVKAPPEVAQELAALEDHLVQNPFTAIGHIKPGRFRRWTLDVILFYLGYATRHFFNRGNLAGVKTIHFARWVFIDGRRRMFFASNYDGSLESYMDDFIDKVAWGLNLVFSNGVGYPRTSWLVRGGARDELAFKDYLRVHQVPTRVWFSAYGRLTALNIQQNERIRDGLRGGDDSKWVHSL
jgi:hypothetical protein